jgi:hypothetical protein
MPKNKNSMNSYTGFTWNVHPSGQPPGTSSNSIQQQMDIHYKHLNKKLDKLLKKPKCSTQPQHKDDCHFCTRVENLTNIRFTQEEMQLLQYGMNYSIEKPTSTYAANLIAEMERAIRLLDTEMQNTYRIMAEKKLKQIIDSSSRSNMLQKRQLYVVKELNKKSATKNAIVIQADEGKTIVIINSKEYSKKVHSFLTANNFNTLTKDPTEKFQKLIYKTMQECNLIIDKHQIKYFTQKKATPPDLKAQLKLHKIGIAICPVINNRTAPAYKLAKHLTKILDQHNTLQNHYTVTNSINLANDLTKLETHKNHRLITFDTKDLYVNIP